MDQINLDAWVGRTVEETGHVSPALAGQIHAAVGDPAVAAPPAGGLLPGLWHWCAFPPLTHSTELGRDGHPASGPLLPPVHHERRMWAGGSLRFHAPVRVGDRLTRRSALRSVETKAGASGPLVVMSIEHLIHSPAGLAIEERQDIVFLDIPPEFSAPRKRPMPGPAEARHEMTPPVLFRYSAVTFNAHRIHYDVDYARGIENYPDLVVHAPLQATLLMRHATQRAGRMPLQFEFRALHPMFAHANLEIATRVGDGGDGDMTLFAGQGGVQGMTASAIWDGVQ